MKFRLQENEQNKNPALASGIFYQKSSNILAPTYSRANALPSALGSLTAVFEMGTGVTSLEGAPEYWNLLILIEN